MPDSFPPGRLSPIAAALLVGHDSPERRSATAPPNGLPIVSTEPLTARERAALHDLARGLRFAADIVEDALAANRVDRGLEACALAGDIGIAAQRAGVVIGSGR